MVRHVTAGAAGALEHLPAWISLVRAPNPGPMTLDGTNTWVVRAPGARRCLVIDPGPLIEEHLAAVAARCPVAAILATHSHPDHVEGLARFEELTGVAGITETDEFTAGGVSIRAIRTPGHTSDSVCFLAEYEDERVVFTGDTVLGRGTTVVAYPDGDLGDYLDSLRHLALLGPVPVLPGHGPALESCADAASFYLEHRLARLAQVRDAREAGATEPAEVVASVYADVDRSLWPAAELSVRAALAYLTATDPGVGATDPAGLGRESLPPPPRLDPP
jgi:glyoxylase-like metal-dependent hydrolase (beta-lactamase superfamily II)